MGTYCHLNISERNVIHNMISSGERIIKICEALGRHRSTVYRELKRNKKKGEYLPEHAQVSYEFNRKKCVYQKPWDQGIFSFIIEELKNNISPDAISGRQRLLNDPKKQVSTQTIYNWVIKGILGKGLQKHLLYGKKGYAKPGNSLKSLKNKDKKRIDKMPEAYKDTKTIGHFQADTVHGRGQSGALATFVDTHSRYILADKIEDNGSEVANFKSDEEMLNCEIYFTYPGRPWEKALIENSNRLLRRFFPKNMKFHNVTREMVDQAVEWLNHLPRKTLGYRTAYEVFHGLTSVALGT